VPVSHTKGAGLTEPRPLPISTLHPMTHDPTFVVKASGHLARLRCCVAVHRAASVFTTPYRSTCHRTSSAWVRVLWSRIGLTSFRGCWRDYACRPRLRSRLTLGGLACPRNPWSFGGGVSPSSFATHACILTRVASTAGSLRSPPCPTTPPYPPAHLDPKGASGHSSSSHGRSHNDIELLSTLTTEGRDIARVPQLRRCA